LKRDEAISVISNFFTKCNVYDTSWVSLTPPDADNVLSHGYQIHIKMLLDEHTKDCLEEFLQEVDLGLTYAEEKGGLLIIYRPEKNKRV
jgi:hypothetical protein